MNFVLHRELPPKTKRKDKSVQSWTEGAHNTSGAKNSARWDAEKGHPLVVHAVSFLHRETHWLGRPQLRTTPSPSTTTIHTHTPHRSRNKRIKLHWWNLKLDWNADFASDHKTSHGRDLPPLVSKHTQEEELKWRFLTGTAAGEHKARATICLTRVKAQSEEAGTYLVGPRRGKEHTMLSRSWGIPAITNRRWKREGPLRRADDQETASGHDKGTWGRVTERVFTVKHSSGPLR